MLRVANLIIDPAVFDDFPESLAREACVLPIGFCGEKFLVLVGRRPKAELIEALKRVAFITYLRLAFSLAERDHVKALVDEFYSHCYFIVANCSVEFQDRCPGKWLELRPTDNLEVRHCDECKQLVHYCDQEAKALEHTRVGHRIARFDPNEQEHVD